MQQIDLSWSGAFGGDGDGTPRRQNDIWWLAKKPAILSIAWEAMNGVQTPLHVDGYSKFEESLARTYHHIFKVEYPPYAMYSYGYGTGEKCDRCGCDINLLNAAYYMCLECNETTRLERNGQNSLLSLSDERWEDITPPTNDLQLRAIWVDSSAILTNSGSTLWGRPNNISIRYSERIKHYISR